MNQITDYHPDLEWSKLSDLEPGECYALSTDSPLTYLMLGTVTGRYGRSEYDVTTLVGPSSGRAGTRTYYRGETEVLLIPPGVVGERLASAVTGFTTRNFTGIERVQLSPTCWPLSLAGDEVSA